MVKDTGLLVVEEELEEVLLQQQHMAEVELEHQEIPLQDHLLVVEMHPMIREKTDLQTLVVAVVEVKEVQPHPINSIQVEQVEVV